MQNSSQGFNTCQASGEKKELPSLSEEKKEIFSKQRPTLVSALQQGEHCISVLREE